MKLLVIGASGRTGSLVIDEGLRRGDEVVAYARRPEAVERRPGLTVLGGEMTDSNRLTEALRGVDAVVCCLGPRASLRGMTKVSVMTDTLPPLAAAMQATGVKRLVLLSAMGVGGSARRAGLLPRLGYKTVLRSVYDDKMRADKAIHSYALDRTWVLPGRLTDDADDPTADVKYLSQVHRVKGMPSASRATVARVLVDAAHDDNTIGQQLVVSGAGTLS